MVDLGLFTILFIADRMMSFNWMTVVGFTFGGGKVIETAICNVKVLVLMMVLSTMLSGYRN